MSYILPAVFALILHLSIAAAFIWSQWSPIKQSRSMPRHIQAQMYDLSELTTAKEKSQNKVKEAEISRQQQLKQAREKEALEKAQAEKAQQQAREEEQQKKRQEVEKLKRDREKVKQEKEQQRKAEQKKLEQELEQKKQAAKKQREIESKRKLEAEKAAEQKLKAEEKARKEKADKKKAAELAARKKAEEAKKRKEAAKKKKQREQAKRDKAEKERLKALQRQIDEEEQFAADQVAAEMATGVGAYVNDLIKRNFRIPSTARKGISAVVRIKVLPSGRIIGVDILKSSGNTAFDSAAEQAVLRTENLPKIADIARASRAYFDRELRTMKIVFKPEDLRW